MKLEENIFPIKVKNIDKGLDISVFGVFEYYITIES